MKDINNYENIDSISSEIFEQKIIKKNFFRKEKVFVLTPDQMELKVMIIEETLKEIEKETEVSRQEIINAPVLEYDLDEASKICTSNALDVQEHYIHNMKEQLENIKIIIAELKRCNNQNKVLESIQKLQKRDY